LSDEEQQCRCQDSQIKEAQTYVVVIATLLEYKE